MNSDEATIKIREALTKMGCTDVTFTELTADTMSAVFNCKDVTSFVAEIPGWVYTGIYLNPIADHQYRIDFKKI